MECRSVTSPPGLLLAPGPRVSTIYVRALIEAVEAAGVGVETFVRTAGISPQQFASPYGWVDAAMLDRWLGHAVELSGDPAFGLHWSERSPMMRFDLLAITIAFAPSLREGLACLQRFQAILYQHPEVMVEERDDTALLRCAPLATSELALRLRTEVGVCCLVRLLRHVGAPDDAVRRVDFAHGAPGYASEYERLFGGRALFAQQSSGIEVDAAWLDRRVEHANGELYRVLTDQAHEVLARIQASATYTNRVRDYIRLVFPRTPETLEVARALALSDRSLRRRLMEEGATYSAILQETRKLLAWQLIADPKRSIQQVGREVGFTSGPAFQRAFKRWTGDTPGGYRDRKARPRHEPTPGLT
jgi:AraC-like DNA-binding protein